LRGYAVGASPSFKEFEPTALLEKICECGYMTPSNILDLNELANIVESTLPL